MRIFPLGILLAAAVFQVSLLLGGCAGTSVVGTVDDQRSTQPPRVLVAEANELSIPDLPKTRTQKQPLGGEYAEDLFDPFAKADEGGEEYDPWEPFNTFMFEFNRKLDKYALKPVAQGYDFIIPDFIQVGVSNMFYNLRFPQRFLNNVFQGKVKGASIEVGRFLLNTTVGYAGFLDLAKEIDLVTPDEDFGQTLGVYGVKPGPYLVVPFLQPFTVRDAAGYVTDIFLNPINWLVAPIIEVEGIPSLIAHKNRTTTTFVQIGARVGEIVNERSRNLEKFQGVEEATLDLYTAVRNAYLQSRKRAIRE
ncbi:MAG TPA: VacJ family lipoprotein [Nitrospira sp.]|nr:VacJ family lipoprotein [Nitrospira sp.]